MDKSDELLDIPKELNTDPHEIDNLIATQPPILIENKGNSGELNTDSHGNDNLIATQPPILIENRGNTAEEMLKKALDMLYICSNRNKKIKILYATKNVKNKGVQINELLDDQEKSNNDIILELNKAATDISEIISNKTLAVSSDQDVVVVKQEFNKAKNAESINKIINKSLNNVDIIKEGINREKNKSNAVMYGMKEQDDHEQLVEEVCTKLNVNKPNKIIRIGQLQPGKNRPIKLLFKSKEDKNNFFTKYLKEKTTHKYIFYIKNDLTKQQQQQLSELIQNENINNGEGEQTKVKRKIILRNGIFRFKDNLKVKVPENIVIE